MIGMWVMKMVFVAFIRCITDIVFYVEYQSEGDNRSEGIKYHLRSLGATVRDKFTKDVSCEYCRSWHGRNPIKTL